MPNFGCGLRNQSGRTPSSAMRLSTPFEPTIAVFTALGAVSIAYPEVLVILGHAGFPVQRDAEYFAQWKSEMSALAKAENVACKISGFGMADNNWSIDSIRPWVMHCIEAFGVNRGMLRAIHQREREHRRRRRKRARRKLAFPMPMHPAFREQPLAYARQRFLEGWVHARCPSASNA